MAAGDPIKLGSASGSSLVPEPGWQIQTNDFGTDVAELTYNLGNQSSAMTVRPSRGDSYSGGLSALSGFICDSSAVMGGEGTTAKIKAVYMLPNPKFKRVVSVTYNTVVLNAETGGVTTLIPIPEPAVVRRYVNTTGPEYTFGQYISLAQGHLIGFPNINAISNIPGAPISPGIAYLFNYLTNWVNTGIQYEPRCNNQFYEIEENWAAIVTGVTFTPA